MIVKWFKYGSGNGNAAFNYLLNHRVKDGTSKVIRGSANLTLSIIQSLKFKKKYKSGCLSFEELNVSKKIKNEIMDLFEKTLFPGISEENRNIVWIEHTDKNRVELNYVIPRVELSTFKSINPYFHRVDKNRFNAFRDYVNLKYGFTNPNDPTKKQKLNLGDLTKYSKAELQNYLHNYISKEVENKNIKSQSDVINLLKEVGYEISRVGKDYISVKTANNKAIRLKGLYYSKDWNNCKSTNSNDLKHTNLHKIYKKLQNEIIKTKTYYEKVLYGKEKNVSSKNKSNSKQNVRQKPKQEKKERRNNNDIRQL